MLLERDGVCEERAVRMRTLVWAKRYLGDELYEECKSLMEPIKKPVVNHDFQQTFNRQTYGATKEKVICPHCKEQGNVRGKIIDKTTISVEDSLVGKMIGQRRKTITKVTQLHCDNCGITWEV